MEAEEADSLKKQRTELMWTDDVGDVAVVETELMSAMVRLPGLANQNKL